MERWCERLNVKSNQIKSEDAEEQIAKDVKKFKCVNEGPPHPPKKKQPKKTQCKLKAKLKNKTGKRDQIDRLK